MAIISIPSSIGGVAIPGNLLKGPLSKLFGGNNQIESYIYPRDLGSATRGHWIQFVINEIQPTQYDEQKIASILKGGGESETAPQGDQSLLDKTKSTVMKGVETVQRGVNAAIEAGSQVAERSNLSLKPRKERIAATIGLYMPDGVSFTNQASYGEVTLLEIAKDAANAARSLPLVGKFAGALTAGMDLATSNAGRLTLQATQGLAINPGQQLLFDGIDFRTYSLSFTFTPYSREEAETVKNIIKLFRTHAAPRISDSGMFFIPPSTFNLAFYKDGNINTNITAVGESVIESIEVNYTPNGWSAHTDGAPVQTTLTMSFKEIELVDRKKIEFAGY